MEYRTIRELSLYTLTSKDANTMLLYLTPLSASGTLPMSRILLRDYPKLRNRVFGSLVGFYILHGYYLISKSYGKNPFEIWPSRGW